MTSISLVTKSTIINGPQNYPSNYMDGQTDGHERTLQGYEHAAVVKH